MMRTNIRFVMQLAAAFFIVLFCGRAAYSQVADVTLEVLAPNGEKSSNGVYDTGKATVTINGTITKSVDYGQFSTPASIASGIAAMVSRECFGIASAKADGALIRFHLKNASLAPLVVNGNTNSYN